MNFEAFQAQINSDDDISAVVRKIDSGCGEDALDSGKPRRYLVVGGADALFGVAAYALFRFLKDRLDHGRAMAEIEVAKEQARLIGMLIDDGFEPAKAQAVAQALLREVAKRAKDDPVLTKARALLGGI